MPLYRYVPESGGCDHCQGGFELLQSVDSPTECACPQCGTICRRAFAPFKPMRGVKSLLSPKNLERHGFTQYRRTSEGYEKVCGPGPDFLRRPR